MKRGMGEKTDSLEGKIIIKIIKEEKRDKNEEKKQHSQASKKQCENN